MAKWLSLIVGVTFGVTLFLSWKWYAYVTNTRSPYDEVGIELNGLVPQRMNDWGCGKLRATFPLATPPLNCADPGGGWRDPASRSRSE